MNLLDTISKLAGVQRDMSFRIAAQFIMDNNLKSIVETGCYRGIHWDGQSTAIFALLAKEIGGTFTAYDINSDSIDRAKQLLADLSLTDYVTFVLSDSIKALSLRNDPIQFAYLDSFDFNDEDPMQCQRHQLAEVGALWGKMKMPCGILIDDCGQLRCGGKGGLSSPFLEERGWTLTFNGYQKLYTIKLNIYEKIRHLHGRLRGSTRTPLD